ncbi:MAG: DNA (cytosine-5-)-methyltransferase [Rickettsiales bacterium]|nr:MAG: DNA (cytosine-5-)-methyltransferase [Rickettsiales bacterium]
MGLSTNISWNLSDLEKIESNGYKVFSCFSCAGGSSMGYELAGYDVLGNVEIDPKMMRLYLLNLKPKYPFMMGIEQFNHLADKDLPKELFDLDILDGSPPCSSFSVAGVRESKWGKKTAFREGQKEQVLDDLFFHFINTASKLKPKVVIAENVKGLIIGKARGYVKQIIELFNKTGYKVQLFLLDSSTMGVPQKRERTFFVARRDDLNLPELKLSFSETAISTSKALQDVDWRNNKITWLTENTKLLWQKTKLGAPLSEAHPKGSRFNEKKLNPNKPATTLTTHCPPLHWALPRRITVSEAIRLQTFPDDYNFANRDGFYPIGMSVPPFMMQRLANEVQKQWLDNLEK